jgi:hypothetical protein
MLILYDVSFKYEIIMQLQHSIILCFTSVTNIILFLKYLRAYISKQFVFFFVGEIGFDFSRFRQSSLQ